VWKLVGSGTNVKSMAFVGNIAAFLVYSLTLGPGGHVSNYVDGPDMNTRDLVVHINTVVSAGRAKPSKKISSKVGPGNMYMICTSA
jgi:hypothetical protein